MFLFKFPFIKICVRYLIEICEKTFISLWTLLVGILRSRRLLVVGLQMVPLMHAMMIIGGRTVHTCWVCNVGGYHISLIFLWWLLGGIHGCNM